MLSKISVTLSFLTVCIFGRPTVCLNMIVKDEAPVIENCLKSVMPHIDSWVIVDTGSTDGTQEIIKAMLKDKPGKLYEKPWVNFGFNRNEALQLAKNEADYLLFIDADEVLKTTDKFDISCITKDYYGLPANANGPIYYRTLLIKTDSVWAWKGVVHEQLLCQKEHPSYAELPGGLIDATSLLGHRAQDPNKFLKDAKELEKGLLDEPENLDYQFYLAQSYYMAGQLELAHKAYLRRAQANDNSEFHYDSLFMIANIEDLLKYPKETVVASYTKAHLTRPTRAEPLFYLALYYGRQGDHYLSYLTSKYAATFELPKGETWYVHRDLYEYKNALLYADRSFLIGRYDEAINAYQKAMEHPNCPASLKKEAKAQFDRCGLKIREIQNV